VRVVELEVMEHLMIDDGYGIGASARSIIFLERFLNAHKSLNREDHDTVSVEYYVHRKC
jgi:hypothetical protein